jgi:serine/threonine protein kinase
VGNIWEAKDIRLDNEPVACKILRDDLRNSRCAVADLKREVLLTRKLRHAHILPVFTFWDTEAACFITMEYVQGENLIEALSRHQKPFALDKVLPWLLDLSNALDYAHSTGILHRDIKPSNILLAEEGGVQLADFGIARTARESESGLADGLTQGTLLYMSPEQLTGQAIDHRSDLYGLAATIHELLAGAPPFLGSDAVSQIQVKPVPPIPHLSQTVNDALRSALAKNPENRPNSCQEFYEGMAEAARTSVPPDRALPILQLREDQPTEVLPASASASFHLRLGDMLIKEGILSEDRLYAGLGHQERTGEKLGAALVTLGFVTEEDIANTLSQQLNLPKICLDGLDPERGLCKPLDRELSILLGCAPVKKSENGVVVAVADPLDMRALNRLETAYGEPVELCIATGTEIRDAIDNIFPPA